MDGAAEEGTPPINPRRAELEGMKVKALKRRAKELGVEEEKLEDADDADDVKEAVIVLIEEKLDAASAADRFEARLQLLREELGAIKSVKALKKRAKELGVHEEKLDDADDADDVKGKVIDLIVESTRQQGSARREDAAAQQEEALRKLRDELLALSTVKALKKRAKDDGVDEEKLEDADDTDDVRRAVIELVIERARERMLQPSPPSTKPMQKLPSAKPHFSAEDGSGRSDQSKLHERFRGMFGTNRHCMFSYNWATQESVQTIRDHVKAAGIPVWMDIDGGMKSDIYNSMADGVSNAACVVCFMTQAYQDSANCSLELKFAKQSGVPIVPVMMEAPDSSGRSWKASSWLGVITAGSLWTPLWDSSTYAENIPNLLRQIEIAAAPEESDDSEYASDVFSPSDARDELERLRKDQQPAVANADAGGMCALPAQVPDLPEGLRITSEMKQLLSALVSSEKQRIGFCGMGGIGKTTISTWLVREGGTRRQFEHILWVPLGQEPNLPALQELLHLQLTGNSFEGDQTPEMKQEHLRQAMTGKHLLLVMDDLWEPTAEKLLNFIDDTTRSKVLLSSRVRGVLEGAEIVDVGLPSEDEAVQMLLSVAGLPLDTAVPPEAREVVEFCDRLPLALSIAGKLVHEMGVIGDWEGVVEMMKDEFSDSGQDRSMEERIIRTSLNAIKGPHRDKILRLFHAFAIVPEDTRTPIEIVKMLFEVESETPLAKPPSLLSIRRWLKILIDRSLILGTVDRPSCHDLVMDYVVAAKTDEERRGMNRRLVNLWRACRPAGGWNIESKESVPLYITLAAVHHIKGAWRSDDGRWSEDKEAIAWLSDFDMVQDAIPVLASEALGAERMAELAKAAEDADDYWLAALRWSASALSEHRLGAHGRSLPLLLASAKALESVETNKAKNKLEMSVLLLALQSYDPSIDQVGYTARIKKVLDTNPDDFDSVGLLSLIMFTEAWPSMQTGDLERFKRSWFKLMTTGLAAIEKVHASDHTQRCLLLNFHCLGGAMWCAGLFPLDESSSTTQWDLLFGKQAGALKNVLDYGYAQMHAAMRPITSFDVVLCYPGWATAPMTHWGDLSAANAAFDHFLPFAFRCMEEWSPPDCFDLWYLKSIWPLWLYLLGRKKDARAVLHAGPYELGEQFDWIAKTTGPLWRPRSKGASAAENHSGIFAADDFLAHAQFLEILVADEVPPASEALAGLPEPDTAAMLGVLSPWGSVSNYHFSTVTVAMLAHELLGSTDGALRCAAITLEAELPMGGTTSRLRHSLAHATRGRILAAKGRADEAEVAFEAAIAVADSYGGQFFAALALRDMCKHVLDDSDRAEEGRQRLVAKVGGLVCSIEDLERSVYP